MRKLSTLAMMLMLGTAMIGCESPADKRVNAEKKVEQANEDMNKAAADHDAKTMKANAEYQKEAGKANAEYQTEAAKANAKKMEANADAADADADAAKEAAKR
jgi:hypothetical protein